MQNFITFWHEHLLSLTKNYLLGLKVKCYENSELKLIRGEMNQNPKLNRLPFEVIWKVRYLKIHKKMKEDDVEEQEDNGIIAMA